MPDTVDSLVIRMTVKTAVFIIGFLLAVTSTAVYGWMTLNNKVDKAEEQITTLKGQVAEIRCLLRQQNDWHIYKIKPERPGICGPR